MTYNGHALSEFIPERTAVYVTQEDQHMPELTVRETLDFSARCQGTGSHAGACTCLGQGIMRLPLHSQEAPAAMRVCAHVRFKVSFPFFECPAMRPVRQRFAHLFAISDTMQMFIWQEDLLSVACYICACMKRHATLLED